MYTEQRKTIEDVWRYANGMGEKISYTSFYRHFKNHLQRKIDYSKAYDQGRNEVLRKVLQQDIEIAKEIRDHLDIIHNQIEKFKDKDDLTIEEMRALQEWISQARLTIEQLLKHEERLMPKEVDITKLPDKLLSLVEDFPPEQLEIYTKRLGDLVDELRLYGGN